MKKSLCGVDCTTCSLNNACKGCIETNGKPFGGECLLAECTKVKKLCNCTNCKEKICNIKKEIINEINNLNIKDMPKIIDLTPLSGAFINIEYKLPNKTKIKLLEDKNIYLGNQIQKKDNNKCYGLVADKNIILICQYEKNGENAEILLYKKRNI